MKWKSRLAARWVEEVEARGEGANTKVHKEEANMKQKLENEEKRRRMLLALQPSQLKKIVHHLSRSDIDFIIRAYKNKKGFEKLYKENVVRRDLMKSF